MRTIRLILLSAGLVVLSAQLAQAQAPTAAASQGASEADKNKTMVRRYYDEVWNKMKLETTNELFQPPFQIEQMKDTVAAVHFGIPDIHFTVDELFAGEDGRVVATFTASGTHSAELFGVAPTGKKVSFSSIEIFRLKDGKIYEKQNADSRLLLMQQIGALCKQAAPK
ncbi:MAG TPA: ester cyclase [Thermoanaerobaculia bacterium]|jgi:predicted ester cyclase